MAFEGHSPAGSDLHVWANLANFVVGFPGLAYAIVGGIGIANRILNGPVARLRLRSAHRALS